MIWPTDLVFDPTFPIFVLDRDIVKMIILSKFHYDWTKTVASIVFTMFFYDLTYWPCFWPDITHIQTWLRFCQDDHSEQVCWWLNQNCGLYSAHNVFLLFYLLTLFFDPTSPIFEHNWDIVKMIILSKFYDDWTKTVTPRVFRRFILDLTYLPSFWPNIAHIQTWLRYCHDDHSE